MEGLVTRNTHVQFESPITSGKKVMVKVKVFAHRIQRGHRRGRGNGRGRGHQGYDISSPDIRPGSLTKWPLYCALLR